MWVIVFFLCVYVCVFTPLFKCLCATWCIRFKKKQPIYTFWYSRDQKYSSGSCSTPYLLSVTDCGPIWAAIYWFAACCSVRRHIYPFFIPLTREIPDFKSLVRDLVRLANFYRKKSSPPGAFDLLIFLIMWSFFKHFGDIRECFENTSPHNTFIIKVGDDITWRPSMSSIQKL